MASTRHINAVINTLGATNPTVLAWDIKNELDRDYTNFGEAKVKAWATEMISHTRQLDSNHLITLGFYGVATGTLCYNPTITNALVYNPVIAAEFVSAVDFISMHYFLSERCFEYDLQRLQAVSANKPIILEEFGLHTLADPLIPCTTNPGNPRCDDPHTEIEQAAYYNALFSLSEAYGLAGYLFWTLIDFSYILPDSQESHHCQGILRNGAVNVCEAMNPDDYSEKPAADTTRRHYDSGVAYLDLFDAWVESNTDEIPPGWSDNWSEGGALLRGYQPSRPLSSHNQGQVAFTKVVSNGTSITGLAVSPMLKNIDVDHYPFLTGQVSNYSVRDAANGSNSLLHIGVMEGQAITRLLTITPNTSMPYIFTLDLRQLPTGWTGNHDFQIVLELTPEANANGYSAAYEFDWIALKGFVIYLPLIIK
ncbi:MAG: hypothetical protein KDI79_20575 [Anaerolineae bacterium]|nr:hypothetical protein [Anaerolineae bacterium]